MHALSSHPPGIDLDSCCQALAHLIVVRNQLDLPPLRRRAVALQLMQLCDQIEALVADP